MRRLRLTSFAGLISISIGRSLLCFSSHPGCRAEETPSTTPTPIEASGLHNVWRVTADLYSGSGPESEAAFAGLAKLGVRTIISVDGAQPRVALARPHGIQYFHIPLGYSRVPRDQSIVIGQVLRTQPGPIYLHCHHGQHRGPAAAAAGWLATDPLCSIDAALRFMRNAGTDPKYVGLYRSVEHFQRPSAEELQAAKLPPAAAPVAKLTEAMVAVDETWSRVKKLRAADWRPPADQPDLDPAHEVLQLLEQLQEMQRLPDGKPRPVDFRQRLESATKAVADLETHLRSRPQPEPDRQRADDLFNRIQTHCHECHAKHRDVP